MSSRPLFAAAWILGCQDKGLVDTAIEGTAPLEGIPEFQGSWLDLEPAEPLGLCRAQLVCEDAIPDEPKIDCQLDIWDDQGNSIYADIAGVEVRGRSSYWAPKPQYSIELRNAEGDEQSVSLMGMPAESDWVLNGMYFDRSLLRNTLGYDLFRGMGYTARWAPASAWCTLELNGEEWGLYSLVERIKRADGRISISEDDGSGSSFVLKLDDVDAIFENYLGYGGWKPVYPKPESLTESQELAILAYLEGWYGALESEDPHAEDLGVWSYVDMDSLVDFVLLQEFMRNNDAYYLSVHLWKDRGGLVHFAPWDLDLSLGQPNYNDNENPEGWIQYRPDWLALMTSDPEFVSRLETRWVELRESLLAEDTVFARIERYQGSLEEGLEQNFELWPIETIQFSGDTLYEVGSYDEELDRIQSFIHARSAWMDDSMETF
jgi:hypothetical protein